MAFTTRKQRRHAIGVMPFVDLLIGDTALGVGYSLLTINARHFHMIPGFSVMQL
jgi:predicted nucleic acid-binding protein